MLRVVADEPARRELTMSLDELAREGARRMLAAALETEVSWPSLGRSQWPLTFVEAL